MAGPIDYLAERPRLRALITLGICPLLVFNFFHGDGPLYWYFTAAIWLWLTVSAAAALRAGRALRMKMRDLDEDILGKARTMLAFVGAVHRKGSGGFCEHCPDARWWPCDQYKLAYVLYHMPDKKLLKQIVKGRLDFVLVEQPSD